MNELETSAEKLIILEEISKAIKDYCCDLINSGKDMVEVTEFNADIQRFIRETAHSKTNCYKGDTL